MHHFFPESRTDQLNWIQQTLMQLDVDVKRLWTRLPIVQTYGEVLGVNTDFLDDSSSSSTDCDGEDTSTFFDIGRVFTFTLAGLSTCTGFNRAWTLTWDGTNWSESVPSGPATLTARILGGLVGDFVHLQFAISTQPGGTTYRIHRCDAVIPGVNNFTLSSVGPCTGWPGSINVTCT